MSPAPDAQLVLLLRHGNAQDHHPLGDRARGLDDHGREVFRRHARRLAELVHLEGIVTSPLVRAVQTAEILAEACGVGRVEIDGALVPEASAEGIVALAKRRGPGWALVGHNPSLEDAVASALSLASFQLGKGAAVALRPDGAGLSFAWLAAPDKPVRT